LFFVTFIFKIVFSIFFFKELSFNVMRLSIGSVVVVLVALKGSVLGMQVFLQKILSDEGGWRFSAKPQA